MEIFDTADMKLMWSRRVILWLSRLSSMIEKTVSLAVMGKYCSWNRMFEFVVMSSLPSPSRPSVFVTLHTPVEDEWRKRNSPSCWSLIVAITEYVNWPLTYLWQILCRCQIYEYTYSSPTHIVLIYTLTVDEFFWLFFTYLGFFSPLCLMKVLNLDPCYSMFTLCVCVVRMCDFSA